MPAPLASFLRRLGGYVRGFSPAQRTVAIIGVAVLVLGGIALTSWLSRPSYAPLFTGLQASDASAIVDQLTSDGVSYQLQDGGSTILVPQDKVYAERLKAASNNLPSSTTSGYALLDNLGVTSSQFQQDVTYKQAMEDELASTIEAMNDVKTASVKLAIPEETVFTQQTADPTASVFVATAGNQTLTSDQVNAIVHLTSASIPNMKPSDVSVVDAQGEVLSTVGGGVTDAAGGSGQNTYDTQTQQSLQKMLDTIVGPGNSTVAVSADIDNNTAQQTSTQYSIPTGSPAATESSQSESYNGTGASGSTGVLGPDNIAVPNGTNTAGNYTDSNVSKSNALNQTTTTSTIPPGAVTRQTVSVAVSSKAAAKVDMNQLTQLVQSASGYNASRGDIVTVQAVPFSTAAAATAQNALATSAAQQAAEARQKTIGDLIVAGAAAFALIAVIVVALFLRRRRTGTLIDDEVVDSAELTELLPMMAPPAAPVEAAPPTLPLPRAESAAELELRKRELGAMATSDPSHAAAVLRTLMEQEVQL